MARWLALALALTGCAPATMEVDAGAPSADAAVVLDGALGGEDADAEDAGAPLALDAWLDTFFVDLCAWFVRCEPKLGAVAFGETLCHPVRVAETRARFLDLVESGEASFDPAVAAACLSDIEAAACNVAALDLEGCDAAFVGTLAPGASCTRDLSCREGRCVLGASCPGTCRVARAGEGCTTAADCEGDLGCVDGACVPLRDVGEACARRTDCRRPLVCGAGRTCAAPPGAGEACATGLGGDLCGGDLVCTGGVCVTGAGVGEACAGTTPCAPGGRCVEGACVATASPGGACARSEGCIALHACVAGVCAPLPSATGGEACTPALPCVEGGCVDGRCALLETGAACSSDPQFGECAGGCAGGTCRDPALEGEACGATRCAAGLECREADGRGICRAPC